METQRDSIEGWAVLEILGHRRLGGYLREQQIAGAGFLRIDIPGPDGAAVTQFYSSASVYGITPCSEEAARAVALANQPAPVSPWEIRQARSLPAALEAPYDDTLGEEYDDDYDPDE